MRAPWLVVVLLAATLTPLVARGEATLDLTSSPATSLVLNVGTYPDRNSFPASDSSTTQFTVQNSGGSNLDVFVTVNAPSSVSFTCAPCSFTLPSGGSQTVQLDAFAGSSTPSANYATTTTVSSQAGNYTLSVQLQVRNWRGPALGDPSGTFTANMPCPRPAANTDFDIPVVFSDTGDYALTVQSVSFFGFPWGFQSLNGFGSFTVSPGVTVTRGYRVTLGPNTAEGARQGTLSINTDANDVSVPFTISVVDPVKVDLPTETSHDFGDVPLLTASEPWSHLVSEGCGYKAASVTVDASSLPTYATANAKTLTVTAGGTATVSVSVRFTTAQYALLYHRQYFPLKLTGSDGTTRTYSFNATPVFVNTATSKAHLIAARDTATYNDTQRAAALILAILIDRTEAHAPTTDAEIADAAHVVALAEPTASLVGRFEQMKAWNNESRENDTVRALVAASATVNAFGDQCDALLQPSTAASCRQAIDLLRNRTAAFAADARAHFAALTQGGTSELALQQASTGLGLALAALGDDAGSKALLIQANGHFANFTHRLQDAQNLTTRIDARRDRDDPWLFLAHDGRLVAWNPVGFLFLAGYERATRGDYAQARSLLVAAGDPARIDALDAQTASFESTVRASAALNAAVAVVYAALLLALVAWSVAATRARRRIERASQLGRFLLPESRPPTS